MIALAPPFSFDIAKNLENFAKHDLYLSDFAGFDNHAFTAIRDVRRNYGEERYRAFGRIDEKPYMVVLTIRDAAIRLISFRRCHSKEIARYERS